MELSRSPHGYKNGVRPEFQILDDEVEIAGFPCRVLRQGRQSEDLSRTWYVDAGLNWRVLRYVGRSSSQTAQIDIRYEPFARDSESNPWRKPIGWSCMIFSNDEAPVQAFCKSLVQNVTFEIPSLPDTYREALPAGTWVIDKRNDTQYIVTAAGGRRIVTQQELQFYPTHAEIMATPQGKLIPSIEKQIFWNRLLRNPHLWLIVVVCVIACSIVLSRHKRRCPESPS